MGQYHKYLSVAAAIIISYKCPIIAEQIVVIFIASLVTIATVESFEALAVFERL